MKKYLICLLLFAFIFPLLPLHAQDTLVLRNGQKMSVKVISVTDKINYTIPPGDNPLYIKLSKVNRIKYKDGFIYTVSSIADTIKVQWKPYIVLAGGLSIPFSSGYGGDASYPNPDEYEYSGYATTGSTFSATAGVKIYKGWEITGMFSYIRNPFNASALMNATASNLIEYNDYYYNGSYIDLANINAIGNYYYTNYAGLLGVTKNWEGKHGDIGISIMSGFLYTQTPALHAAAFDEAGIVGAGNVYGNENCYFNINAQTEANFDFEMALHADLNITKHIFLRGQFEFQFSRLDNGGNYQIVDMATGNVDYSGGYLGTTYSPSTLFVWLTNITGGIGYKF